MCTAGAQHAPGSKVWYFDKKSGEWSTGTVQSVVAAAAEVVVAGAEGTQQSLPANECHLHNEEAGHVDVSGAPTLGACWLEGLGKVARRGAGDARRWHVMPSALMRPMRGPAASGAAAGAIFRHCTAQRFCAPAAAPERSCHYAAGRGSATLPHGLHAGKSRTAHAACINGAAALACIIRRGCSASQPAPPLLPYPAPSKPPLHPL